MIRSISTLVFFAFVPTEDRVRNIDSMAFKKKFPAIAFLLGNLSKRIWHTWMREQRGPSSSKRIHWIRSYSTFCVPRFLHHLEQFELDSGRISQRPIEKITKRAFENPRVSFLWKDHQFYKETWKEELGQRSKLRSNPLNGLVMDIGTILWVPLIQLWPNLREGHNCWTPG